MIIWPAKSTPTIADYSWIVPLDTADTIASFTAVVISGDAVIDSRSNTDTIGTVWLSSGSVNSQIYMVAVTEGARTFDETATLVISASDAAGVADFLIRFPSFVGVPSSTISYWLTDAQRFVDSTWATGDYSPAIMAAAAHHMALNGLGLEAAVPQGLTRFKSGTFEATYGSKQADATGWGATRFGIEYLSLLNRNKGGPYVASSGTVGGYW